MLTNVKLGKTMRSVSIVELALHHFLTAWKIKHIKG